MVRLKGLFVLGLSHYSVKGGGGFPLRIRTGISGSREGSRGMFGVVLHSLKEFGPGRVMEREDSIGEQTEVEVGWEMEFGNGDEAAERIA